MSYILDALKKSERERTLMRGVGFGDAGRRWSGRRDWSLGATVIGAIAAAAVAAIAVMWARSPIDSTQAKPNTVSSVAPPVTPDAPAAQAVPARAQTTIAPEPRAALADATAVSGAQVGPVLFVSAMAPEFQRNLPAMTVNIHVYSPEESQRILYINNRQYRRDDEIPGGVVVEEIVPDGVVLQFRGQRFKLPRPS